jgi:hypothetical protein
VPEITAPPALPATQCREGLGGPGRIDLGQSQRRLKASSGSFSYT